MLWYKGKSTIRPVYRASEFSEPQLSQRALCHSQPFQVNGLPHERLSELTNVVMDAIGWEQGLSLRDTQNQISVDQYDAGSPPTSTGYSPQPSYLSPVPTGPHRDPPDHLKLKTKLLQLDIDLRRQQIRETKARTAYFQAATKLLNEKRSNMTRSSTSGQSQSQQQEEQEIKSEFIVVDPSVLLD